MEKRKKKKRNELTHGDWRIDTLDVALLNQNLAGTVAQVFDLLLSDELALVELLNLPVKGKKKKKKEKRKKKKKKRFLSTSSSVKSVMGQKSVTYSSRSLVSVACIFCLRGSLKDKGKLQGSA